MQLKASAPGSLMLMGEYAVLNGKPALVCAVNKRLTVLVNQRQDDVIDIESGLHGHYQTTLSDLTIEKPFHFILGVIKQFQGRIKRGFDIQVTSDFSDKLGLGSSAAITVATMAAIVSAINMRMTTIDLIRQARNVIRQIQGVGSGADVAAAVHGGVVSYQAQPLSAEKIAVQPPLTVLYAGFKTPTVEAIKHVQNHFATNANLLRSLYNSIGQCTIDALPHLRKQEWAKLGHIMNVQQGLMEALSVSTPLLYEMVNDLRNQPDVFGAKISGSGLGDCVVALGNVSDHYKFLSGSNVMPIPVEVSMQGVLCEKI